MASIRTGAVPGDAQLLDAARNGDEAAFGRLVEPHRRELHAHCYRMLGSVHDAEDAQQDALLRAWKNLAQLKDRDSLRAWLYRIATNASLDAIARRPKKVLPMDFGPSSPEYGLGMPPAEGTWVDPYPDGELEDGFAGPESTYEQRESVELAFIAALQHLAPLQRAALILREVLGFSAKEVADTLDTTVPAVNSALQRARQAVDERLPEQSQQETLRALGDDDLRQIVEAYMEAMANGEVDTVISMLTDEAAWSMPPLPAWFSGLGEIREFLSQRTVVGRLALASRGLPRERPGRGRQLHLGSRDGALSPVRGRRAHDRGPLDQRDHIVHRPHDRAGRRGGVPPVPGARARPAAGRAPVRARGSPRISGLDQAAFA